MLLVPEDTPILERIDFGDSTPNDFGDSTSRISSLFSGSLNSISSDNPLANPFSLDTPWRPNTNLNRLTKVPMVLATTHPQYKTHPTSLWTLDTQFLLHPLFLPRPWARALTSWSLSGWEWRIEPAVAMIDVATDKTTITTFQGDQQFRTCASYEENALCCCFPRTRTNIHRSENYRLFFFNWLVSFSVLKRKKSFAPELLFSWHSLTIFGFHSTCNSLKKC